MTATHRRLRFGVEVLDHEFDDAGVLAAVEENIPRFGIEEILFWGSNNVLNDTVRVPDYPHYTPPAKAEQVRRFRQWLGRYRKHGLLLVADGREPHLGPEFFEACPEARDVTSGTLWDFIEKRIQAVFDLAPELDRIESFLWETWLLNGDHYFEGMHWSADGRGWQGRRYYEPVDYLAEMIAAFARGAAAAGKEYAQKGFSTRPWQERVLVDAILRVPRDVPLRTSTQMQIGDFNPFMAPPALVPANQTRPMTMYFDCFGEYLGRSQIPYCYPERMQARLRWALRESAALDAVRGRVNFSDRWNVAKTAHLFDTPNEINLVALAALAENPDCCMGDLWRQWASERYGPAACEAVTRALRRTPEIVRNSMFFHGATLTLHSQVPTVPQMLGRARHLAQDAAGWCPDRIEANAQLDEMVHDPSDYVLGEMLQAQRQAQRLCEESIEDIEAARRDMPAERYERLRAQFAFTAEFLAVYERIVEVFVRVRMRPERAPSGNDEAVARCLDTLAASADYADANYGGDCIIQGDALRGFIDSARAATPSVPGKETD